MSNMNHSNGSSPSHQPVALQQPPPGSELLLPADVDTRVQQLHTSLPQHDLVQQLSGNVEQLLCTVRDQQATLQQQQAELQQLRQTVSQLQQQQMSLQQQQQQQQQQETTDQLHNTQHRQQLVGWSNVRPFDAQKAALVAATPSLGDRRAMGMFDARYHSTSR
jgi:TolA-binding protein